MKTINKHKGLIVILLLFTGALISNTIIAFFSDIPFIKGLGVGLGMSLSYFAGRLQYKKDIEREDTKLVRRELNMYFITNECYNVQYSITDVEVESNKTGMVIIITTNRPGILIGKGGKDINHLTEYLNKQFKVNIQLKIKECKLWHKLYSR